MDRYTIYCTREQTKKAFELGAPIERGHEYSRYFNIGVPTYYDDNDEVCRVKNSVIFIPTAEQMIGWLEEQGISVKAMCFSWCNENKPTWQVHAYQSTTNFWDEIAFGHSESCKEATLSAIDAALDYLSKNKEK